jgi:signal transduction histidine kinase
MASENAPVLFPTRHVDRMPRYPQDHASRSQSVTSQLVQTIAATLDAPDALPRLTEFLGLQLTGDACLLLRFHQVSQELYYTFWQPGEPVQFWSLSATSSRPQEELQCRIARGLIENGIEPSDEPDSLSWREGLETLLAGTGQVLPSLEQIQTCQTLPITAAPDMEARLLLLHLAKHPAHRLDQSQKLEVASLLGIALHQHYLQDQTQRCHEQLNYLNYLKEDFLSTLNHELRTPLTSMMLAIRMLRRPDLTPERASMYLDILEQQCSRETNLVNDLLMLQSVSAQPSTIAPEAVDLGALLGDIAEREQGQFARAHLQLKLDLPDHAVILATSRERLNRVLRELLTNARKYAASNSSTLLSLVDNLATDQSVEICVTSIGAGIQTEELPHIFDKFRRGQSATKHAIPGTGTGLALVKGLLEQMKGTITVSSQPLHEQHWQTCFKIELPAAGGVAKFAQTCPE